MKSNLEEQAQIISEYFEAIQNQLIERLKTQNNNIFKTTSGDYEVIKIERCNIDKLNIENGKFHHLFSQDGCKISGTIIVKALAYGPNSDKNMYTSNVFEIVFNNTTIKFNFDDETFVINENINISFITLSDRRFY